MLSKEEKQEILNDAKSAQRRFAFRKARIKEPVSSFDAYLQFLSRIKRIFRQTEDSLTGKSKTQYKL